LLRELFRLIRDAKVQNFKEYSPTPQVWNPIQMQIFHFGEDLKQRLNALRKEGKSIGFVPTMGALHPGHLSLLKQASENCAVVVVSIFVNPTQFNEVSDFENYPSTLTKDIALLSKESCDILFTPAVKEMYPDGTKVQGQYNLGYIEEILEGKYRPGHFQGVCQIVDRLLDIVNPDQLYLGEKDFQQCKVIQKLLSLTDRQSITKLVISPTIRESDGLAMSSRNQRLNEIERGKASLIYQCLIQLKKDFKKEALQSALANAKLFLSGEGFEVDYVEIIDETTFLPVSENNHSKNLRALVAAKIGAIRLIDNMPICL
jgi:pantoate--beta-alanine ligase